MSNISPVLPLTIDPANGFLNNHTEVAAVIQDLKMLLLTSPGERVMDPDFGVGMRRFLFEQNNSATHSSIRAKIIRQVSEYLPFIDIEEIMFNTEQDSADVRANGLLVAIRFIIAPLGIVATASIMV
tara:strand:+ start:2074 stop:2454 length:381 start_codon:yes stop_codon:yes gene_type:complete